MIRDLETMKRSVAEDAEPPDGLGDELRSLWYAKQGEWEVSHEIAQEIDTPMGSWIHALLHLIEGDVGNAGYWFRKAGQPSRSTDAVDALWREIAVQLLDA